MTFTDYLINKKIDTEAFKKAEPLLFEIWETEFEQMHPNSFTAQKLYLINPLRRKYTLPIQVVEKPKPVEKKIDASSIEPLQQDAAVKVDEDVKTAEALKPDLADSKSTTASTPARPARPVFKPKPKI